MIFTSQKTESTVRTNRCMKYEKGKFFKSNYCIKREKFRDETLERKKKQKPHKKPQINFRINKWGALNRSWACVFFSIFVWTAVSRIKTGLLHLRIILINIEAIERFTGRIDYDDRSFPIELKTLNLWQNINKNVDAIIACLWVKCILELFGLFPIGFWMVAWNWKYSETLVDVTTSSVFIAIAKPKKNVELSWNLFQFNYRILMIVSTRTTGLRIKHGNSSNHKQIDRVLDI